MRTLLAALGLLCLAAPGLAHEGLVHEGCDPGATFTVGPITVSGAFTRAMAPNAPTAAGYLTITNGGSTADRLVSAASEAAEVVQLHEMKMEGDMMKMGELGGGIEIPAGSTVQLAPMGLHVMFIGVGTPFAEGECVAVTLQFEQAGHVPVMLAVGSAAAKAPPEGHRH